MFPSSFHLGSRPKSSLGPTKACKRHSSVDPISLHFVHYSNLTGFHLPPTCQVICFQVLWTCCSYFL
jgi:hypothetical protein